MKKRLLLVIVDIDGKESMKRESKLLAYNLEEKSLTNGETSLSLYSREIIEFGLNYRFSPIKYYWIMNP